MTLQKVPALELWILRQHICLHIAECRLRPALDSGVKGPDDVFFKMLGKMLGAPIRGDDCFAISVGEFRAGDPENIAQRSHGPSGCLAGRLDSAKHIRAHRNFFQPVFRVLLVENIFDSASGYGQYPPMCGWRRRARVRHRYFLEMRRSVRSFAVASIEVIVSVT
jgi:hypothetical protein